MSWLDRVLRNLICYSTHNIDFIKKFNPLSYIYIYIIRNLFDFKGLKDANILDERHVHCRFPKQRVSILDVPKWWRGVLFLSWSILFFLNSPWVNYWHGTVMLRYKRRFKGGRFQKQCLNTKLRCMILMLTRKREEKGWKMLQANGPVGSVNYSPHFHSSMIVVGFCYSSTFCPLCFFISFIFKFKSHAIAFFLPWFLSTSASVQTIYFFSRRG